MLVETRWAAGRWRLVRGLPLGLWLHLDPAAGMIDDERGRLPRSSTVVAGSRLPASRQIIGSGPLRWQAGSTLDQDDSCLLPVAETRVLT